MSPRAPPVPASPALGLQACVAMPSCYIGAKEGAQALVCAANTLLTEPSS